ncbi:MAG: dihydrofolate reductase, partial [Muribaculaceae bacterium]|nr:dihydrofolate reductase [Muribaculaceae bacterium]
MITIIAAITRDHALGRGGDMIYHISADLKRFKQITMGHPVVMGRRTYESLPRGPLPGRRNLVITSNPLSITLPEGAVLAPDTTLETYPTLAAALEAAGPDPMIIGGGQVYAQA